MLVAVPGSTAGVEIGVIQVTNRDGTGLGGSQGLAVSPDGKHVYSTGSFDDALVAFSRGVDGTLAFVEVEFDGVGGVDGLESSRGVAISPDGQHVYVAALFDNSVATFSRNSTTGAVTFVEVDKDGGSGGSELNGAQGVTVSPDGDNVYVVARSADAISVFERNSSTGALTFLESEVEGIGGVYGLDAAEGVVVSPDGDHVYVASEDSSAVVVFERDDSGGGNGSLTYVETLREGVGGVSGLIAANSVAVSADGSHVYVSGQFDDGTLGDDDLGAVFSRNATTGRLTFIEQIPPFLDDSGSFECLGVSGGGGIAVNGGGDRVYVTESWQSSLLIFSRNPGTGRLSLVDAVCGFLTGGAGNINVVAVSPGDANVYTTGLDGNLTAWGPECDGLIPTILGTQGVDNLVGTANADVIAGLGGNDTIDGGGGDDTICGGTGNDTIDGGSGDDLIIGGPGNDAIDGGPGEDTASYATASGPVMADLSAGAASGADGTDSLTKIRHLVGSEYGDKLSGNAFGNTIEGRGGNDKIKGKKGNDTILGGDGDDILQGRQHDDDIDGGSGVDTASFFLAPAAVTVDLAGGTASGEGSDTLAGIENVNGSRDDDTIFGDSGDNVLVGFKGNDELRGAAGDDTLRGKPGDDALFGNAGDDRLLGGGGNDTADGGAGSDVCVAETTIAC